MLKATNFAALALLAGIATSTVFAADKVADQDKSSVATVNDVVIPQARMALLIKIASQPGQQGQPGQPDSDELRKAIKDNLVNLEVLSQEANKKGLAKQADIEQTIALERQKILANHLIQDFAKSHPISEEQLKQEYDTQKARMAGKEFKTAHILVATEAEAKAIVAQLRKKGSSFEKIAKEKSNDPGSKQQGGDLGWSQPNAYVPEFAAALAKLTKNEISEPVQTKFGWHIIKLNDVRDTKVPSFDEVKMQIQNYLQNQSIKKYVEELRANAKIE